MELDATSKARIATLNDEMDSIHHANSLYWRRENRTLAARAGYNSRNERLEKIRAELAQIRSASARGVC
jgi:hypothetical protein